MDVTKDDEAKEDAASSSAASADLQMAPADAPADATVEQDVDVKKVLKHKRMTRGHRKGICRYPGCSYKTSRRTDMLNHVKAIHLKLKPFACPEPGCAHRALTMSKIRLHISYVHTSDRRIRCRHSHCDFRAKNANHLSKHMYQVHEGRLLKACHVCQRVLSSNQRLQVHMQAIHAGHRCSSRCRRVSDDGNSSLTRKPSGSNVAAAAGHLDHRLIKQSLPQEGGQRQEASTSRGPSSAAPRSGSEQTLTDLLFDAHAHLHLLS